MQACKLSQTWQLRSLPGTPPRFCPETVDPLYIFMDNDIMIASKKAGTPVPFSLTAKDADGRIVASGELSFDATAEKMYLTVTADGRIMEDKDYEG